MPAPVFTTNDSEISRLEGLYVKERTPPGVIKGIFLGNGSVCGETVRGPVGKAVEITSRGRFLAVFGGRDYGSGGALVNKVWKSLLNKPFGKLFVTRAYAAAAVKASSTFANVTPTNIIRVDATSVGTWGNNVTVTIAAASDADSDHFNLEVSYLGATKIYKNLDVSDTDVDNTLSIIGDDDANWVTVTKLANGRPLNASDQELGTDGTVVVAGTNGSIADSDFTGTGKAMELTNTAPGCGFCWVAERSNTSVKDKIETLAASVSDRQWIMCPDSDSTSMASSITDAGTRRNNDGRIIYAFNHPYTQDPETGTDIVTNPDSWMASILSQIDVDIDPGEEDTKKYTAGITRLSFPNLVREDYISLREAGVAALENDDGFTFVSAVTTSLESGKERISRRRMTDYLQLSPAKRLKFFVKKKNTLTRRKAILGELDAFLSNLKRAERIVEDYELDGESLNTDEDRAEGIERVFMRVKLISHILELVLETEVGTAVEIKEGA